MPMTGELRMPAARRVPVLSLRDFTHGSAAARLAFQAALFSGLTDYGFIVLREHGVATTLLEAAYELAETFFALPLEEKRATSGRRAGYTDFGIEHARYHLVPDLKEFYSVTRDGLPGGDDNRWPVRPAGLQRVFNELYTALGETGRLLLQALAPSLQLPADWFDAKLRHGDSLLRAIHYPPVSADMDPQAVRSAAHEDINLLTLLVAARGSVLQLLDRDGVWLPVDSGPQELIVDSGDMLQRLSNGVIPSTTHRVVNPEGPNVSRYSMPFFLHPESEMVLDPLPQCVPAGTTPRYPPCTAGEYLEERLREIGLKT